MATTIVTEQAENATNDAGRDTGNS